MKTKGYVNELMGKTADELQKDLVSAKKELFNLRFQNATNQLDNTARIKEVRKNIARIQTIITSKRSKIIDIPFVERRKSSWKEIFVKPELVE